MRAYRIVEGVDADTDVADILVRVMDLGMACCAVEFAAAVGRGLLVEADPTAESRGTILVVSGTVTDVLAPAIRDRVAAEPCVVVSFGACSTSGGPYWDSYSVTKGIDQLVPVHSYVPGCPPRPEALVAALRDLVSRWDDVAVERAGVA